MELKSTVTRKHNGAAAACAERRILGVWSGMARTRSVKVVVEGAGGCTVQFTVLHSLPEGQSGPILGEESPPSVELDVTRLEQRFLHRTWKTLIEHVRVG
jgi:hypothetical protein